MEKDHLKSTNEEHNSPVSQTVQGDVSVNTTTPSLSTCVLVAGSTVTTTPYSSETDSLSLKDEIAKYQAELETEIQAFEDSLTVRTRDDELETMDWDDVEQRYDHEMSLKIAAEQNIMEEFSERFKQFMLWMQVSNEKEAERALKRLRTRVAFVQNSEEQLAAKQEHYAKVLGAFQDAVALLGNL